MEYYSIIRKNEILPFAATWMDLKGVMPSEISQRKTNTVWYHLYVESKKKIQQINEYKKRKQTHRYREQTRSYQEEEERGDRKYRGREIRGTNYYV